MKNLNNTMSHSRESVPITITGRITDNSGVFVEQLEEAIKLDPDANYHVYLNDFTSWSNIPNVFDNGPHANNMFYYKWGRETLNAKGEKTFPQEAGTIEFPTSLHSVITYDDYLKNIFIRRGHYSTTLRYVSGLDAPGSTRVSGPDEKIFPVSFSFDLPTMRVTMKIAEGSVVEFKDGTWYRELGFEKGVYTGKSDSSKKFDGLYIAPNLADIVKCLNILIRTNLSTGWYFKGKRTNILFNLSNNVEAGHMLSVTPSPVKRVILSNKHIDEITLTFQTEDGLPVNFGGEEFLLTIVLERM